MEENKTLNTCEIPAEETGKKSFFGGKKKKKGFWRELLEWVVSLAVALVIVLICQNFLFTLIRVDGDSMYSTLHDGERLFVTVADVKFGDVERNDVVICHYPHRGNTYFVKRVVAVPGDTLYRENNMTHVVYETVDESGQTVIIDEILDPSYPYSAPDYEPYVLGEDQYFVVGDNRNHSHDSRDWDGKTLIYELEADLFKNVYSSSIDVGPIPKDMITGHVRTVIWPLSEIRGVE